MEPTLLDELCCHIGSLASVYHKPPSAFVDSRVPLARKTLPRQGSLGSPNGVVGGSGAPTSVIRHEANEESLIGDLVNLDLNAPGPGGPLGGLTGFTSPGAGQVGTAAPGINDLLGGDLDVLVSFAGKLCWSSFTSLV